MKMRLLKLVCSAAVLAGAAGSSGCVSYGNTHALLTPVGVVGYHSFKPDNAPAREIQMPRDPNQVADAKAKEEPAADNPT